MKNVFPIVLGVMFFLITLSIPNAKASEITTETKIIEVNQIAESSNLKLFLGDGRIAIVLAPSEETTDKIYQNLNEKTYLKFVLKDPSFEVLSFEETLEPTDPLDFLDSNKSLSSNLESVVSRNKMEQLFNRQHDHFVGARGFFRRSPSQCFRRAHVWAYEMEADFGVASGKFFLMYGNRCQTNWWFHVTPYVVMRDESGRNIPMTMDKEYEKAPKDVHGWSKDFLKVPNLGSSPCKILEYNQFNTYLSERASSCCHIIRTSRFYFYPDDMKNASNDPRFDLRGWTNLNNAYSEYMPASGRRF